MPHNQPKLVFSEDNDKCLVPMAANISKMNVTSHPMIHSHYLRAILVGYYYYQSILVNRLVLGIWPSDALLIFHPVGYGFDLFPPHIYVCNETYYSVR
jgi:hypothetical protein